jgi:hypothetical protein
LKYSHANLAYSLFFPGKRQHFYYHKAYMLKNEGICYKNWRFFCYFSSTILLKYFCFYNRMSESFRIKKQSKQWFKSLKNILRSFSDWVLYKQSSFVENLGKHFIVKQFVDLIRSGKYGKLEFWWLKKYLKPKFFILVIFWHSNLNDFQKFEFQQLFGYSKFNEFQKFKYQRLFGT